MLKKWRLKAGLTQAQLADRLGYSTAQYISNIERKISKLPVSKYKQASKILGIPMEVLIEMRIEESKEKLRKVFKFV
jgi:transcriptional regulator with XRE-family HTH domain